MKKKSNAPKPIVTPRGVPPVKGPKPILIPGADPTPETPLQDSDKGDAKAAQDAAKSNVEKSKTTNKPEEKKKPRG